MDEKTKDFDGEEEDYEKYGASFCTYGIKHALFEKKVNEKLSCKQHFTKMFRRTSQFFQMCF